MVFATVRLLRRACTAASAALVLGACADGEFALSPEDPTKRKFRMKKSGLLLVVL